MDAANGLEQDRPKEDLSGGTEILSGGAGEMEQMSLSHPESAASSELKRVRLPEELLSS
jgi:hypothetical protein